ncbi:hypothetical protein CC80DRAFT_595778 [Byssothecium circinans]|uniref:Uncharacterized protein n=1 Tax=Byssothecium circinans TaxID=147558 RepID=A0A6A5TL39_9PLEO|nr:hypothetical protein CC80DRAFT_595778 [Byssothecium circinans]
MPLLELFRVKKPLPSSNLPFILQTVLFTSEANEGKPIQDLRLDLVHFKIKQISRDTDTGHISYSLYQVTSFTPYNAAGHPSFVLDCPRDTKTQLQRKLAAMKKAHSLAWHHLSETIINLYDASGPESYQRRPESLTELLQNEINLVFNLVAQRDSQVMRKLGELSHSDNNNMKSIAMVGLIYLPGTFVSGPFGMNFLDFSDDSNGRQIRRVSNRLRMYWAITIPLTFLTIVVWVVAFHGGALQEQLNQIKNRKKKARKIEA